MHRQLLRTTYLASFLLSLQVALTVYINSSFLATKIPENLIGVLYTVSAIISVAGLFAVPRLINRFGSSKVLGFLTLGIIATLFGMIMSSNLYLVGSAFILYFTFTTLIYLGIDILIEHWSQSSVQGSVRGTYLTIVSFGYMASPIMAGFIADRLGYGVLYGFAIVLIIPVFIIVALQLPSITNTHASKANILQLAHKFIRHKQFGSVFFVNFLLQFFYAWMVIYTPIYLHTHAGISWDKIGIIFTVMLSAFVLLEYLYGKLADRFKMERSFMVLGLLIMGVATIFVTKAPVLSLWALTAILFVTRVGASMVEVMTESYFFRHVHHDDTGSIGFFRNTYPFAYILTPIIASVTLKIAPMWTLFVILGIICCLGIFVAMPRRVRV